ncbi:40S ribosomal protein S19S [Wuchereria bancrofti]|uniref:40S ribosomal protein S19S n=1 Tax=Wuchereria bancrofti TaxID=6293 RepID=J9DUB2_WUCBA|nr:40S ribosomal protein S19S [Wuchereria bancrofti]
MNQAVALDATMKCAILLPAFKVRLVNATYDGVPLVSNVHWIVRIWDISKGVDALRRVYGGGKQRGITSNHFCKASGSII